MPTCAPSSSQAVAAAVWLRRGERALAQLLRAVAASTFRPLLLAVAAVTVTRDPAGPRPPSRAADRTPTARDRILAHCLGRRGPPCSPAFA
jgi:hypothetical protein